MRDNEKVVTYRDVFFKMDAPEVNTHVHARRHIWAHFQSGTLKKGYQPLLPHTSDVNGYHTADRYIHYSTQMHIAIDTHNTYAHPHTTHTLYMVEVERTNVLGQHCHDEPVVQTLQCAHECVQVDVCGCVVREVCSGCIMCVDKGYVWCVPSNIPPYNTHRHTPNHIDITRHHVITRYHTSSHDITRSSIH